MMPPPPKKYTNIRIWHHLQVFFDGGGVKKKLKVGQIQKSFQTKCDTTSKFIFVGGGVKKISNKKARAAVQMHECSGLVKFKNPCGNFSDTSNFFSMEVVSKIFSTQTSKISGFDTLT